MKEGEIIMEESKAEKRGRSMMAMGLVERIGEKFKVSTPSLRGKQADYWVMRNQTGKVVCDCLEFMETSKTNETFRCEHIFAVKFALLAKAIEPEKPKQQKRYFIDSKSIDFKDEFISLEYNGAIYTDVIIISPVAKNAHRLANEIVAFLNKEQI